MKTIPVDLTKTGGRLLDPGVQALTPELLQNLAGSGPKSTSLPAPAAPPPPPIENKADDKTAAACRNCGHDPTADPDKPSNEDVLEFAQSVWRDEAFTKTYTFFGGAVSVTFRTLTEDEINATQRAVAADQARSVEPGLAGFMEMTWRGEDYQFALSVQRATLGEKTYAAPMHLEPRQALETVQKAMGGQIAYRTIRTAYREFFKLVGNLIKAGQDPSFWPATPGSGPSPASPAAATSA